MLLTTKNKKMTTTNYSVSSATNAKETVLSFVNSLNEEDFKTARSYVSDDMTFAGVLGSRNGAEAYFKDMEKMKLKYEIKKVFAECDDVCLLSDVSMQGVTMFTCSWYHVEGGKINSLKVVFDPRPVLELSDKK